MSGSSGIGEGVGTSPYPTQTERETTAFVQVNKGALAIVPDSIELVFTQFGGNIWKYQSGASRPTLAPLMTVRDTQSKKEDYEGIWKQYFEGLKDVLPPDIKAKLEANAQRSREDRDPSLAALNDVLRGAAKFLALVDFVNTPSAAAETRNEANVAIPSWAFEGLKTEGKAFVDAAKTYLETAGANSPDHDAISGTLNDLAGIINGMNKVPQGNK